MGLKCLCHFSAHNSSKGTLPVWLSTSPTLIAFLWRSTQKHPIKYPSPCGYLGYPLSPDKSADPRGGQVLRRRGVAGFPWGGMAGAPEAIRRGNPAWLPRAGTWACPYFGGPLEIASRRARRPRLRGTTGRETSDEGRAVHHPFVLASIVMPFSAHETPPFIVRSW